MKIKQIGQALDEIKEEDQNNLRKLENEVERLEGECSSKEETVVELKKEYESFEELESLMKNPLEYIHMIIPVLEVPLGILSCGFAFSSIVPGAMALGLIVLAIACEVDATKTLMERYPKILGGYDDGFKSYVNAFKKLFWNKHDIRASLINNYDRLLKARVDAVDCSRRLQDKKDAVSELERELLHLDGYISSVEYIIERQYFEELRDTTDIVQFINKKKELKKVVSD